MVQDGLIFMSGGCSLDFSLPLPVVLTISVSRLPSGPFFCQALLQGGLRAATLNNGSYKSFKTSCGQGSGITGSHFLPWIG